MKSLDVVIANVSVGARVLLDDNPTPHLAFTTALSPTLGIAHFLVGDLPDSVLSIEASGFQLYVQPLNGMPPTNLQVRVGVARDPNRPQDIILPALIPWAQPLPHLEIRGRDFVDAQGHRMVLNGCDAFLDYRLFLDGGPDALKPFLDESVELGFQVRRVFMQGSKAQNQVMTLLPTEPGYYEHLKPFVKVQNARGIVPLLTIGVDNQDVRSPIEHWARVIAETEGTTRLVSYFNEWPKNISSNISSFGPGSIPPPVSDVLWSRGSGLSDQAPFRPSGAFLEFHPVRGYQTAMRDAVASPIQLFEVDGYTAPLFIDEPGRMGIVPHDARFSDPATVQSYARLLSTLCCGAVMHNYEGQRGLLMGSVTRACAEGWTRGMRL